ncbi:unnamed protein product [[Candida] boidinii]|uniref:Unnamed protein product n=1 Tax=Candida boidinii TaxID=5477 RepID=A0ACB5UBA7_CANBO|nr:unnamed protein product [[Candida] boidinii]
MLLLFVDVLVILLLLLFDDEEEEAEEDKEELPFVSELPFLIAAPLLLLILLVFVLFVEGCLFNEGKKLKFKFEDDKPVEPCNHIGVPGIEVEPGDNIGNGGNTLLWTLLVPPGVSIGGDPCGNVFDLFIGLAFVLVLVVVFVVIVVLFLPC